MKSWWICLPAPAADGVLDGAQLKIKKIRRQRYFRFGYLVTGQKEEYTWDNGSFDKKGFDAGIFDEGWKADEWREFIRKAMRGEL